MTALQLFKARAVLGAPMTLVTYEISGQPRPHRYLNVTRQVTLVASRHFALEVAIESAGKSYCNWPKASEITWPAVDVARIEEGVCVIEYSFNA